MRLALITGGSKGLGLSLCQQLHDAGWKVIEFSRSAPHLYSVQLDLASPESVHGAVPAVLQSMSTADCEELRVINNAGTLFPIGPASRKAATDVLANLNTNFTSSILFLSLVLARFQDLPCRKVVANVTSGSAIKSYGGWSLYCAAKAGLESHIRALAVEQRREAHPFIPVNIDPGVMDTDMQATIRDTTEADFPEVRRFIRRKEEGSLPPASQIASRILAVLADPELLAGGRYEVA
jgi:benzil reductase ((S)-benzoin forming)